MNSIDALAIQSRQEVCDHHGEFVSRNVFGKIWSRCPECETLRREKEQAEADAREREERRQRWERKLGTSGIPERFKTRTIANFIADSDGKRRALGFAKAYAANFGRDAAVTGRSAVFVGKPGTGKTHLAVGIGVAAMAEGYSVLFCTVMRAIRRVKDTWGNREASESSAIAALVEPDLLILDEVGAQFGSETERLIMFDVLNERYEKRKPCILLSNLSAEEVFAFLGERVLDRLKEDSGEVIPFDWESYRGRA